MIIMSAIPTQIRIDSNLKKQATILFENLNMDMTGVEPARETR